MDISSFITLSFACASCIVLLACSEHIEGPTVSSSEELEWEPVELVNRRVSEIHNAWAGTGSNEEESAVAAGKDKVTIAPFDGPSELRALDGVCFSFLSDEYVTEFCPYHNITQSMRASLGSDDRGQDSYGSYDSYYQSTEQTSFVLGYWKEWEANGTMIYAEGEACTSSVVRSSRVNFRCPEDPLEKRSRLTKVEEVDYCSYVLYFSTPFACGEFRPVSTTQVWLNSVALAWNQWSGAFLNAVSDVVAVRIVPLTFVETCQELVKENNELVERINDMNRYD